MQNKTKNTLVYYFLLCCSVQIIFAMPQSDDGIADDNVEASMTFEEDATIGTPTQEVAVDEEIAEDLTETDVADPPEEASDENLSDNLLPETNEEEIVVTETNEEPNQLSVLSEVANDATDDDQIDVSPTELLEPTEQVIPTELVTPDAADDEAEIDDEGLEGTPAGSTNETEFEESTTPIPYTPITFETTGASTKTNANLMHLLLLSSIVLFLM